LVLGPGSAEPRRVVEALPTPELRPGPAQVPRSHPQAGDAGPTPRTAGSVHRPPVSPCSSRPAKRRIPATRRILAAFARATCARIPRSQLPPASANASGGAVPAKRADPAPRSRIEQPSSTIRWAGRLTWLSASARRAMRKMAGRGGADHHTRLSTNGNQEHPRAAHSLQRRATETCGPGSPTCSASPPLARAAPLTSASSRGSGCRRSCWRSCSASSSAPQALAGQA